MSKVIFVLIAFAFIILLFWLYGNRSHFIESYKIRHEQTPTEFQNYQHLTALAEQYSDIRLFDASLVRSGHINGDSLIWTAEYTGFEENHIDSDKDEDTYYKINEEGVVIDSFKVLSQIINVNNYLINYTDSYYYSWLIDGDRNRKSITPTLRKDSVLTKEELEPYLKDAESITSHILSDPETGDHNLKIIYYKDNTWYETFTTADYISEHNTGYKGLDFKSLPDVFEVSHFTKEAWAGRRFPDFSISINGSPPEHWYGTSYYNLTQWNKNLKFKEGGTRLFKDDFFGIGNSKYSVYIHPGKNYLIINSENGGHYLIRCNPMKE